VLTDYAKKTLPLPKTLGAAVKLVARMGGHLGRSRDPEPGHQIMWRGYFYLQAMCEGFLLLCE
jgi:hypothetical protein